MATRVRHQVVNPNAYSDEWDSRIRCGWADCENPGSSLIFTIECGANPAVSGHSSRPARMQCQHCRKIIFCCSQHGDYYEIDFRRQGTVGNLAAGTNPRFFTTGRR